MSSSMGNQTRLLTGNATSSNFVNGPLINSTIYVESWGFIPSLEVIVFPCAAILNGGVLLLFVLEKRLHLPFNIYLGSLLLANLCFAIIDNPIDIINFISSAWWLSNNACTVYLYATYVLTGIMINSHVLITINRIWAVTFPYSYRTYSNIQTSLVLCIGMWVYVHIICLPAVLLDTLYYRLPTDTSGCTLNTNAVSNWNLTMQFMIYVFPNLFVILSYPYLLFMRNRRRKFVGVIVVAKSSDNTTDQRKQTQDTLNATKMVGMENCARKRKSEAVKNNKPSIREHKYAFTVLTLLTASVTICWTPVNTYFTVACFMDASDMNMVFQATEALFILQPLLDPIYFTCVLPDLRNTVLGIFRRCSKIA